MPAATPNRRSGRRERTRAAAFRLCILGGVLAALALAASAQQVAPRLTGAMVVANLDKVEQAAKARAGTSHDAQLQALVAQLQRMRDGLSQSLGDDADEPLETISKSTRASAVRADAAAKRVQAWLDASAEGCTRADADAMLAAVTATLNQIAADSSDQKAALPVIDGVETLDKRQLFLLHQGGEATPKFVLTGANLVDAQCANPEVVVLAADGKPVTAQPKLVAAQPGRVEMAWPGANTLAPGSYVLKLTAQRKAFLVGCTSEPPAIAVLQVAPQLHFTVSYALSATCDGGTAPLVLGSGTLPVMTAGNHTEAKTIDVSACKDPSTFTVAASVRAPDGSETRFGPFSQGAAAMITAGLGNGLTISWDPSLHQLFVGSGARTCKGVY
ncbi:MAG TPA: hypothetical protein VFJ87_02560 [Rhodanobacteraceae bacterium]|jgi:hypothetical protein|nr:hypothetical protein [Rhodanobacteraceae bacterium]